jgi:hypothetical protein
MAALRHRWRSSTFVAIIPALTPSTGLYILVGIVCFLAALLDLLARLLRAGRRFFCQSVWTEVSAPRERAGQEIFRS